MRNASHEWIRKRFAPSLAALFIATAVSACSGPTAATPPIGSDLSQVNSLAKVTPNTLSFTYQTINDPDDPTTEVLGINNLGKLVGFYGEGTQSSPENGMLVHPPYASKNYFKFDYPNAADTQITSLNNTKTLAGWYKNTKGQIFGCTNWENLWSTYMDPKLRHSPTQQTELLGINDDGLAVGFYQDSTGIDHSFELDITTGQFRVIIPPGSKSSEATGINGRGDIVGWLITSSSSKREGWLIKGNHYTFYNDPDADSTGTTPNAIGWNDLIVGSYEDNSKHTHGFILSNALTSQTFQALDEPNSANYTVLTSINDHNAITGFYKDDQGNIDGFLGTWKTSS